MLEKETTTPDQYPLSLNSLTNACNQKSSREPVMALTESEVQDTIDELAKMNMMSEQRFSSSRVVKYQHRFCNTEFGDLQFTKQQRAIVCLLLLRGPQTPGELRTRSNRLAEFSDVNEVDIALTQLQSLNDESFVVKLNREAGKRDSRYAHLFSEQDINELNQSQSISSSTSIAAQSNAVNNVEKITELEKQIVSLSARVEELEKVIQQFL